MKLAEALLLRSEYTKKIENLQLVITLQSLIYSQRTQVKLKIL